MTGEFLAAFRDEMSKAQREFWEENTASLLAYANGSMFPTAEDRAEAHARVEKITDAQLSEATHAVAEADAKRCPECRRDYD